MMPRGPKPVVGKQKFEPGVNPGLKATGDDLGEHPIEVPVHVFAGTGNVTMSLKIGEAEARDGHRVRIMHDIGWKTVKCWITNASGRCVAAVELDAHALFEQMTEAGMYALAKAEDARRRGDG